MQVVVVLMMFANAVLPGVHPARKPAHLVSHHRHHLRRIVFHSPIKGSHESLVRQNEKATADELERIQDDAQLEELTRSEELVNLPLGRTLVVDPKLPEDRRYCRPWTRTFLKDFAQAYYQQFKTPLQVNSAVRTALVQAKLRRHNRNAAAAVAVTPEDNEVMSPHLTGAAVDIAKRGMTRNQRVWAQNYLLGLQTSGLIDAEEEFRQPVFHITVYRDYDPLSQPVAARPAEEPVPQTVE
ncbi:MAG TPA: DUF5715 family protein [Terriglobales bacterium]|nr:DUF5715 family protein [Terriglobales bacterium]